MLSACAISGLDSISTMKDTTVTLEGCSKERICFCGNKNPKLYVLRFWYSRSGKLVTWDENSPEERISFEIHDVFTDMLGARLALEKLKSLESHRSTMGMWTGDWTPLSELKVYLDCCCSRAQDLWKSLYDLLDKTTNGGGEYVTGLETLLC
jgi:hypothetical protein